MRSQCKGRVQSGCFSIVNKFLLVLFLGVFSLRLMAQDTQDSSRTVTIRNIHIIGNDKTKEPIITRELKVKEGGTYILKELADTLQFDRYRIYNTNLFNSVKVELQEVDGGNADLLITVDERWYFWPIPLFKLADRSFNDWWYNQNHNFQRVNYGLRLTQFNVRGRNERLRLEVQSGFEDRVIVNYRLPYIDKKQHHGLLPEVFYITSKNLGYETRDHLRQFILAEEQMRRSVGVSVIHTYRKRFYDYHFTGVGFYDTHINDTIAFLNPNYLGDGKTTQKFLTVSYGYQNDTRDNINYPLNGHNIFGSITKSGLGVFKDVDYWSVTARGAKYFDLGNDFYHASYVHGYWSTNDDRAQLNFYGLGFEKQYLVRGYELDLIEGRAFGLTKNTTKKLLWKRKADISKIMPLKQFKTFPIALYGKVFFDGGYVQNFENYENNDRLTDKFIYSIGAGLDIVAIYDVVIRLEYSHNAEQQTQFFFNFLAEF